MKNRILVVEDDPVLSRVLRDSLMLDGMDVTCVPDGDAALNVAESLSPDLIVLDVMLPGRDGFELSEQWRKGRRHIPIVMFTVRGQREDKLRGLSLGVDDYVTKPFDLEELLARVRAGLRRTGSEPERLLLGSVTIDLTALCTTGRTGPIHLTYREYELMRYFAKRARCVVRRDELFRNVWGYVDTLLSSRAVDHAIARLRRKVEPDPHHPVFLHTVHGDGYYLATGDTSASAAGGDDTAPARGSTRSG